MFHDQIVNCFRQCKYAPAKYLSLESGEPPLRQLRSIALLFLNYHPPSGPESDMPPMADLCPAQSRACSKPQETSPPQPRIISFLEQCPSTTRQSRVCSGYILPCSALRLPGRAGYAQGTSFPAASFDHPVMLGVIRVNQRKGYNPPLI